MTQPIGNLIDIKIIFTQVNHMLTFISEHVFAENNQYLSLQINIIICIGFDGHSRRSIQDQFHFV